MLLRCSLRRAPSLNSHNTPFPRLVPPISRSFSLLLGLLFLCSNASAEVSITDLGTLGGDHSFAIAINDFDQVVGESRPSGNQDPHIFLYSGGNLIDISAANNIGPGTYASTANAISNWGQIAANISNGHAAILVQGTTTDLGTFGGIYSVALGINNASQAVGYYSSPGFLNHAFLYSNGNMTPLGPFGVEATSIARGINDAGTIVGSATDSFSIPSHAFVYANGVMTDISPFGNSESYAHAINNNGEIVGEYLTADNSAFHAFIYKNGVFTDIGSATSSETVAYAINDHGQVVGSTWVLRADSCRTCQEYESHAFVYVDGTLFDLNSLLPPGSPWKLMEAFGINNNGKIVGYGLINGRFHAYMFTWSRLQRPSADPVRPANPELTGRSHLPRR